MGLWVERTEKEIVETLQMIARLVHLAALGCLGWLVWLARECALAIVRPAQCGEREEICHWCCGGCVHDTRVTGNRPV
jgi:hypothetical protein